MPFKKFLSDAFLAPKTSTKSQLTKTDLINAESALGRTIFGPIPAGHQREFFSLKKNVWIWHENWNDQFGKLNEMTVRYEVRPTGVFKRINKSDYRKIEGEELKNFRQATHIYLDLVKTNLYH